jgi:hypothetical protein
MELDVPFQVRELVVTGIDNVETALALFFDAVNGSCSPAAADALALLRRVVAEKSNYARQVALAKDINEATALQFAYCRAQVEITLELIRTISDHSNHQSETSISYMRGGERHSRPHGASTHDADPVSSQ